MKKIFLLLAPIMALAMAGDIFAVRPPSGGRFTGGDVKDTTTFISSATVKGANGLKVDYGINAGSVTVSSNFYGAESGYPSYTFTAAGRCGMAYSGSTLKLDCDQPGDMALITVSDSYGIQIRDGGYGDPAIVFIDDLDTGIYQPVGINQFGITTGGTGVLIVSTSGTTVTISSLTVAGAGGINATYGINAATMTLSGLAEFDGGLTFVGGTKSDTMANLKKTTPTVAGVLWYDTTNLAVILATGTTKCASFGIISSGTVKPNGW